MKRKVVYLVLLVCCLFSSYAYAIPELQLPFEGGYTLNLTRGYNTAGTHLNKDKYALDFVGDGCKSWDKPILATAGGTVSKAHNKDDNGYGRYVEINHGGGLVSKYAHLNSISVTEGQAVAQGQEIGRMGNTGNVEGESCKDHPGLHLHFVIYLDDKAYLPEPISGYTNLTAGKKYTSLNCTNLMTNFQVGRYPNGYVLEGFSDPKPFSRPFALTYYNNQGSTMLGYPTSNVYLLENCIGCNSYGASKVYVQDYTGGLCGSATLVMNRLTYNIRYGYLGVVYPILGQLREYWKINFSELGAPVSNEYSWNGKVVQWFEPSDNYYVSVVYDPATKTFQQCNAVCSATCPPLVEVDGTDRIRQALLENHGCEDVNGKNVCGAGGLPLSSPHNLQANTLSIQSIQLTWTLPDGTSDYGIKVYSSGTLIKTLSWVDGTVIANLFANTTYCFQISIFDQSNGYESSLSSEVCATTNASTTTIPANGFTYVDIGTDTPRGKVTYNSDTNRYVVNGTGNGIAGNSTQCKYYYKEQSNCTTVTTRVISHSAIGAGAMSGIMFANNTNSNSDFALLAVTPDKGIVFQYRQNGIIYSQGGDTFDYPVYLRLIDSGSKFTAQYSTTGNSSDWLTISTIIFSLTSNYQVGLFATPASSIVSSAVFEGLKVNSRPEKPTGIRIY